MFGLCHYGGPSSGSIRPVSSPSSHRRLTQCRLRRLYESLPLVTAARGLFSRMGTERLPRMGVEVFDKQAPIERAVVVVPVHNEEALLDSCLSALVRSCEQVDIDVDLVVVLDSCTDTSADIAATWADKVDATVLTVARRNVGAARAAGFLSATGPAGRAQDNTWFATTDADSTVGLEWISSHLAHAAQGAHAVAGTVVTELDSPALTLVYDAGYRHTSGHRHVHGTNLGLRADLYWTVGGFGALTTGEDVDLVARVERAGVPVLYSCDSPVLTSSRRSGRAPDGFAAHLQDLELAIAR